MTGQTILHYEIRELLGEGGMGVVYKALDLKLNRLVALKFLPATFAASNETLERFAQEATALSLLNHPHIATIYDIHQVENRRFLVLEYLAGGTLKARLDSVTEEGKRLPIDEVLSYATQTAEGIAHAHRRGIIHRDIKTSNLMLTEEGRVKITDFGVAKLSRFSGGTTPGSLIGTVRYMSPEQAEGREVDARSDIFSFGVVLFELITGRMPFEAETQQALLVKIATLQAPALGAFRPNVPAELEQIVAKMMMKKPSARYQSVDDVIVNLESLRASALGHTLTKTSRSARSTILNAPRSTKISVAVAAIIASLAGAYFYSH
ncbi:MAG TPA: serine/threonine-protein kinase, partial [Myxococcaceae bacterium]|nr:serine/threonine-protein kinase [Myxococcaceae bacterium]